MLVPKDMVVGKVMEILKEFHPLELHLRVMGLAFLEQEQELLVPEDQVRNEEEDIIISRRNLNTTLIAEGVSEKSVFSFEF